MKKTKISDNVISRLPQYYRCVNELYAANCVRVSSATLSNRIGFSAAQIRYDFSNFGEFGQQGYGYNVRKLRYEIREILGLNSHNTCILLGCGNLGHALLHNFDFQSCGFYMLQAFDINPDLIGTSIGGVTISGVEDLDLLLEIENPSMAVLTVPQEVAQKCADMLVQKGIGAIWNFTGVNLRNNDPQIIIEQVSFADSLMKLSYRLNLAVSETEENEEPMY